MHPHPRDLRNPISPNWHFVKIISTPDFPLARFLKKSQKVRFGWENIGRKVFHIKYQNNVSSKVPKYFVNFSRRPVKNPTILTTLGLNLNIIQKNRLLQIFVKDFFVVLIITQGSYAVWKSLNTLYWSLHRVLTPFGNPWIVCIDHYTGFLHRLEILE
jgi:hypothetical protein